MFTIPKLEEYLNCTYPASVSPVTQSCRKTNISALQAMIGGAIAERGLTYETLEERLHIFTTKAGEKVFIQYPGKESIAAGANRRQYDFRPRIMAADGTMVRDLVFADMWRLVEDLDDQYHALLKSMAALFFRMGRMNIHQKVERDYTYEIVDAEGNICASGVRTLNWFALTLNPEAIDTFDFLAPALHVNDAPAISLEAFIYFFEMILHNEDSKYYDKKRNLSSGRIPTSDSMLLLSSNLMGHTRVSELLQRFVSGFGVAKCQVSEIAGATDNLIRIVDRKKDVIAFLTEKGIRYRDSSSITVRGQSYRIAVKTNSPKIAIQRCEDTVAKGALESAGWMVYSLDNLVSDDDFEEFCSHYTAP